MHFARADQESTNDSARLHGHVRVDIWKSFPESASTGPRRSILIGSIESTPALEYESPTLLLQDSVRVEIGFLPDRRDKGKLR